MNKKKMIYVAGPITVGDHPVNIRKGIDTMHQLLKLGFTPFVPMLDFLFRLVYPEVGYEEFMDYDFQIILRCDALLRIPGISKGADREVKFARENNIPVFFDLETLQAWNVCDGEESNTGCGPKCCRFGD